MFRLLLFCCLVASAAHAQVINRAEYFVDTDPGQGNATSLVVGAPAASVNLSFALPTTSLANGFHVLGLRTRTSSTGRWSMAAYSSFYIVPPVSMTNATTITKAEYFIDTDPGNGNGTVVTITASPSMTFVFNVPIAAYTAGFHTLHFRVRDNQGKWAIAHIQTFYIVPPQTGAGAVNLTAAEYFFDTDPGHGNGQPLSFTASAVQANSFIIPITGLTEGFHQLNIRYRDNQTPKRWSHAFQQTFYVSNLTSLIAAKIKRIEYFIDIDPGFGNATAAAFTAASTIDQVVAIDLANVPAGNHVLNVRAKDDAGYWSDLVTSPFTISNCTPPVQPIVANQSRCNAGTVTFTASGAIGTQQYRWYDDPIAGAVLSTAATFTTPSLTSGKTFYATVYDPVTLCESARKVVSATVTIVPKPIVNPAGSISFCQGNSIFLSAPNSFTNYRWSNGATTREIAVSTAGNYTVQIESGNCQSESSDAVEVIVSPKPTKPSITATGSTVLCNGAAVTLTAPAGFSYQWSNGSTANAIDVTASGTYSVRVTAASGCTSDSSDPIVVTAYLPPAKPIIEIFGSTSLCGSNTVGLLAPSGFSIYQWSSGQSTQGITVSASGTYSVLVGNAANCLSPVSDVVSVTSSGQPCVTTTTTSNAPPDIKQAPLAAQIEGKVQVDLTQVVSDPESNLDFTTLRVVNGSTSRGVAAFIDGAFFLQIDYSGNPFTGVDRIVLEICDLAGACVQKAINIEVIGEVVVYNGITPDGDGLNDYLEIKYVSVVEGASKNNVTIYNRWGDVVFEVSDYDNQTRLFSGQTNSGKELPSGTYFYRIDFQNRNSITGFITLKR